MIYVDKVHMVADSLEELHIFAEKIGLKKHFFEGVRKGHPHYDLTNKEIYNKAIVAGAQIVGSKEILRISKSIANMDKIYTTKVIIAGSRDFNDYEVLKQVCDTVLKDIKNIEIVSGTARGADSLGEQYSKEKGYKLKQFPADWNTHKKAAGYIRNKQMAEYANMLIAFWDNSSKGTKHMIDLAKGNNLTVFIHLFK